MAFSTAATHIAEEQGLLVEVDPSKLVFQRAPQISIVCKGAPDQAPFVRSLIWHL